MKVVLQVVKEASVTIDGKLFSEIKQGLMILVGIENEDTQEDIKWLSSKITNMRVFTDENDTMNLSVKDIDGEILVVSQFTLLASTNKGNRPSFIKAAKPNVSIPIYENFVSQLGNEIGKNIKTGIFGAAMKVALVNNGPVTIVVDSKRKD